MEENKRLLQSLSDVFKEKNLLVGGSFDFSSWKLSELKQFLKVTNRLKGLTNSKKEILLDLVTTTWNELNNNDQLSSSTIDFDIHKLDNDLIELFSPIKIETSSTRDAVVQDITIFSPGLRYPCIKEGMKIQDFQSWTMSQLQEYLADRCINKTGNKNKLVENAYGAYLMGLEVTAANVQEEQAEILNDIDKKLLLEGGLLRLPNPKILTNDWFQAPTHLPDTIHSNVMDYLIKHDAGKAFKGGKSLCQSGHVSNVMTHTISSNLRYCFVRGHCLPEQKLSKDQYDVWVCLHKDSGEVITGHCSCTAGVSGICKHVGGLLWFVEKEVRLGNNLTCTSKKQKWSVPPKRQLKLHGPDLLNNIAIKKPKADQILRESVLNNSQRNEFDPRRSTDRTNNVLTESDIEYLAHITNGNCGLVSLARKRANEDHSSECCNHIEVLTSHHVETPLPVAEIVETLGECCFENFEKCLQINMEQQNLVQEMTSSQSNSDSWFVYRKDRITASKFKDAVVKVNDNLEVINPDKSRTLLSKICGYYPHYHSKATKWGITNEPVARKLYKKTMTKTHKNFDVIEPGFYIDLKYPFVGASPDGLVSCSCHGLGLLEIKCPWTLRNLSTKEYAQRKDSCLETVNDSIRLKRNHTYYYQVQCQMHAVGRAWCDFYLCTTNDSFLERIYFDQCFYDTAIRKATIAYEKLVMPEIFSRTLRKTLEIEKDVKDVVGSLVHKVCSL